MDIHRKMNTLGERVKDLRVKRGLKQGEVSVQMEKATGVTFSTAAISELENYDTKKVMPGSDKIAALATFFGVSTDYLLGLSENSTTKEDVLSACKVTGLKDTAIMAFADMKDSLQLQTPEGEEDRYITPHDLLSEIFSNESFPMWVCEIVNLHNDCMEAPKKIKKLNEIDENTLSKLMKECESVGLSAVHPREAVASQLKFAETIMQRIIDETCGYGRLVDAILAEISAAKKDGESNAQKEK